MKYPLPLILRRTYSVFVLAALWVPAWAQESIQGDSVASSSPCAAPEFRQFDVWVGEWDLTSRMLTDPESELWGESTAKNRIQAALDSCVIVEEFDGNPATDLLGMSVSSFNARLGQWQQTRVDNYGASLAFVGGLEADGRMILKREVVRDGKAILQRMLFSNITADSLGWSRERSTDAGQSWHPL